MKSLTILKIMIYELLSKYFDGDIDGQRKFLQEMINDINVTWEDIVKEATKE